MLTKRQFNEWAAYYECEPWGEERADVRSGMQTWAVFQSTRKRRLSVEKFVPRFGPPPPPPSAEQLNAKFHAYRRMREQQRENARFQAAARAKAEAKKNGV